MIFGKMRWVSMVLASTLSVVLSRFGGLAIAHVAGMLNLSGHGANASRDIIDPQQRSEQLRRLPSSMPVEAVTNEHGFNAMAANDYFSMQAPIVGNALTMERLGGPSPGANQAGQTQAHDFMRREQGMIADRDTAVAGGTTTQNMMYEQARSASERSAGRAATDRNDWSLTGDTAAYGSLAEKAGYLKNRALDDIKSTGAISDYTRDNMNDLNQMAEGRMAFLNSPGATTNLNAQEKSNLKNWLNSQGYDVDTLGSQVRMDFAMNDDGSLTPSGVQTFEGHSGRGGFNFNERHGHHMDMALTPENSFQATQDGRPITFIGGRLTGYEGGYHEIQGGVTNDGQLINGTVAPDGNLIKTSHPSALEISSTSMLNLLSRQALPESHIDVRNNQGAAVEAWVGAVRTYASQNNISDEAFRKGWDNYLGFSVPGGLGGARGSLGKYLSNSEHISENVLADEIRSKIAGAKNNAEALELMQRSYNNLVNHLPDPVITNKSDETVYQRMREQVQIQGYYGGRSK